MILVDLDRFKEVNDTLGHGAGDLLLRELATRLREAMPARATLARLGGDEFAVVTPQSPNAVAALAARLQELLGDPLALGETTVSLEASLGIAMYPADGTDPEELLRAADVAMYLAKGEGSGIATYDPARDENDTARLVLMTELKRALEHREIIPHYQVIAKLNTGVGCGAECLARWFTPERGLLPPSEFLPFMERTGLRGGLTHLILEQAIDQLMQWKELGVTVPLAVNLTMHDLLDDKLPNRIGAALESAGIPPDRLELEITESALMTDPDRIHRVLAQLHYARRDARDRRLRHRLLLTRVSSRSSRGHPQTGQVLHPRRRGNRQRPRDRPGRHRTRTYPRSSSHRGRRRDTGGLGRPQRARL